MAATRFLAALIAALGALMLWVMPVGAQDRVDCGNGAWCPSGHACLLGGQCGLEVEGPAGGVRTSTGGWCDPGYRESRVTLGRCIPPNYSECSSGLSCPPGARCVAGGCEGGPPATGPMCGSVRCSEGRICSSRKTCMNTELFHDCGNGTICGHASACLQPTGCVYVAPGRVPQSR